MDKTMVEQKVVSVGREKIASRARGKVRRQKIINVTAALLMEKGYDSLTMRDVAARAGIRVGNLHYYFPARKELFLAVFEKESSSYAKSVSEAVNAASSSLTRLTAIVETGFSVLNKPEVKLWRVLLAVAQHDSDAAEIFERENRIYHAVTALELKRIAPELSDQRANHLARLIWALLDGLALQIDFTKPSTVETRALMAEARDVMVSMVEVC
jgi:AcrR family transcriptional regulator